MQDDEPDPRLISGLGRLSSSDLKDCSTQVDRPSRYSRRPKPQGPVRRDITQRPGKLRMIRNVEALDLIQEAVRHYLRQEITQGEAMTDVIAAVEASGRASCDDAEAAAGGEDRSWAPPRPRRGHRAESAGTPQQTSWERRI